MFCSSMYTPYLASVVDYVTDDVVVAVVDNDVITVVVVV